MPLEMRVGRPAVIVRIITKNGYGDVLPFEGGRHSHFIFCAMA